ncbi:MAG: response regulator [Caulobacteraceae bacterium]|nr:response regulator [Caulobacteraceae bacterium]
MRASDPAAAGPLAAKLAQVALVTPHAVAVCDPGGCITWVNAGLIALSGRSADQLIGRPLPELIAAIAEQPQASQAVCDAMRGVGARLEPIRCLRGEAAYWLDLDVRPAFNEAGERDGCIAVGVEVTDAQESQARLNATTAALRSAGKLARIGGWEVDMRRGVVSWSPELVEVLGRAAATEGIEGSLAVYPEPDRTQVREAAGRAIAGADNGRFDLEGRAINAAGEFIWMRMLGEAVFEDGVCVAIHGASQDITHERAATAELRESERFARGVIDGIGAMLVVIDEAGTIIEANRAFRALGAQIRGTEDYPMGGDMFAVLSRLPGVHGRAVIKGVRSVLDGEAESFTRAYQSRNGEWFRMTAARFAGEGPVRCVVITQSIADLKVSEARLKEANASLKKARDAADAANAAKSDFLATMSHEIRTPLNGVLGMAQAMTNDDLPGAQRERLSVIRKSGETLLVLLNDLLDLSRIESGRMELEDGVIDLAGVVGGVQSTFQALAEAKGVALVADIAPAAEGFWRGDPTRVRQILSNLVSNAVKFTSEGEVGIAVEATRRGLVLTVSDTGPGVPADRLPLLFDKFVQADASTTRRHGGSGLGLAICKELAVLMGGDVEASSIVGEGSTFTLRLPVERAAAPAAAAPEPSAPVEDRPLRVLAADDNEMNRLVLTTLLGQLGMQVTCVDDGAEAVAAVIGGDWDLVLMDVQMPNLDGLAATRLIRADELQTRRPRLPIIALTANAMDHHRAEYLACGMDAVVAKPIELPLLLAAIDEACAAAAEPEALRRG